jgi:hypothetical protein
MGGRTDWPALVGQVKFGSLPHPDSQGFYPWDENEVTKQIVAAHGGSRWHVMVQDVYINGAYNRTEYQLQHSQSESLG